MPRSKWIDLEIFPDVEELIVVTSGESEEPIVVVKCSMVFVLISPILYDSELVVILSLVL
jgi:hypothetical protein